MTGYEGDVRRWARCRCCTGMTPVMVPRGCDAVDILCPTTDAWEIGDIVRAEQRCLCGAVAETDISGEPVCGTCATHPDVRLDARAAE